MHAARSMLNADRQRLYLAYSPWSGQEEIVAPQGGFKLKVCLETMDQPAKAMADWEGKYFTFTSANEEYGIGILKIKVRGGIEK